MMKRYFFCFLLLIITSLGGVEAQSFSIEGDTAVSGMVRKHVELNSRVKTIPGFRLQIASFSGANSKNNSFSLRDSFLASHDGVGAYVVFDEPNFKVKIGDFRTRLEAYAYLQEIKDEYKGYIVRDNIYAEPPVLVDYAPDDETSGDE
ncbi:SPOR domain-containing protein [bacterium]|nr:SPOR domain-containing protein [bacterium]MBR1798350.1 SPOR domain-containing protein [Bacteroidales bacterium]